MEPAFHITRGTLDDTELAALTVGLGVALAAAQRPATAAASPAAVRWQAPGHVAPSSWKAFR